MKFVVLRDSDYQKVIDYILALRDAEKRATISVESFVGTRTLTQNAAMHLFFEHLSQTLNEAGLDVMSTMKKDVAIPWSARLVKEMIWRPVQKAVLGKDSTTKLNKLEISDVYDVINRHMSENHGIGVSFPSEASLYG